MKKYINIEGLKDLEINNIFCVGKNYADHVKEMGDYIPTDLPVIFTKPNSSIIFSGDEVEIPEFNGNFISNNLHYETEMVIAVGLDGFKIPEDKVKEYLIGVGVGLDMTLRDIQDKAKKSGLPWDLAKGFNTGCALGNFVQINHNTDLHNLEIKCSVNDNIKQLSKTSLMLLNTYKLVSFISSIFYLNDGDLIFTGTPAGVGQVKSGDVIESQLGTISKLTVKIK